ncbi:hypothetical protein LT493_26410 [Streptomyces tricolor]|nr:hypothetical protein [Streptomyces tricolor]
MLLLMCDVHGAAVVPWDLNDRTRQLLDAAGAGGHPARQGPCRHRTRAARGAQGGEERREGAGCASPRARRRDLHR